MKFLISLPVFFCSSLHYNLVCPVYTSYLRPQCQVLLLQVLQLALEKLQLAEGCGGGGSPKWQRLPQRRGHAGVCLALLRGAGHYPQQLVLLTELMLQLVNLVDGEDWEICLFMKWTQTMLVLKGNYVCLFM